MMPKSAALALWVGKPGDQNSGIFVSINANLTPYILYSARQNDFSGIALAIDHTAISTFSNRLVDPQTLHNVPIRRAQIEGLPLKVYLYANSWLAENTQFALLLGVVCGLLAGLLCYYVLTIKSIRENLFCWGSKITSSTSFISRWLMHRLYVSAAWRS